MRRAWARPAAWAGLLLGAGWVVWSGSVGDGLSGFLPQGATAEERLVSDELRRGLVGRLLFIVVRGPDPGAALGAAARLRGSLAPSQHFSLVADQPDPRLLAARAQVFEHRYLLSDRLGPESFQPPALRRALGALLERLRGSGAPVDERLAAADPTGEFRYLVSRALGGSAATPQAWESPDGWPLVLALTRAPSYRLDAQAEAIGEVQRRVQALGDGFSVEVSGAPAIALEARARIREAAVKLTALAAAAVLVILGLSLRSVRAVALCTLPVGSALLVGTAAVVALFGQVHGITLAFAATLLGVTVDYPLHLCWHQRRGAGAARGIRRPLLAGAVSTALGFAALGMAGFPGLQQLAVLSVTGILTAMAATLWVLPALVPAPVAEAAPTSGAQPPERPRGWALAVALAGVAAGIGAAATGLRLDTDLARLSPVPEALKARDGELRAALGVATPRHVIRVAASDPQQALARTEAVATRLESLQARGMLDRFHPVTALLPSADTQLRRRGRLPAAPELEAFLAEASAGLPLRPHAFAPFVADVAASRSLAPLRPDDLPAGFLREWLRAHLFEFESGWSSLVGLGQVRDAAAVQAALQTSGGTLVDVAATANRLVTGYQRTALVHFAAGSLAMLLVIGFTLGSWVRTAWVALIVAGAVGGVVALKALDGGVLNLFEVISLLLVTGLGIDYAVFSSESAEGRKSVSVCAASTVAAFGLLATADISVLRDIGTTVAAGALMAWLLALGTVARRRQASGG